jgi:DNA-binding SARP family transcriptional activator/pimeloyl-ACP methyl ester carboxylesterase
VVIVVLLVEPHHADVSCHPTAIRLSTATRRHSLHQRPQEAGVRFRVLGPVEVRNVDDRTVELGERPRRLLAVLLANANRVVGVDAIADAVWGATSPANPGQAVQTVVSRLRGRLGADVIETRAPGYRLVATADDLDALALVDLLQRARETDDDQTAVDLIGGALALPRGEPYAGFADEAWARAEAGRLAELLRTAVEERGQRLLEVGRATEAIPELEAFVAAQPLRERAQALLMRGLHRVGRQADALAAYRRYRETVADELGLEPSRELQELERAILTDTLSATPSAGSATAPGAPHWTAPTSLTPKLAYLERAPGERIAVATVGAGPPLVYPPSWVSRIDILTSGRDIRSGLLDRLARDFTVRVFDRYGTGLSRGELRDFSFEASVDEVLTVLDTLPEPAPLVAISSAGPIAVAATARSDRVSHLVLLGTYADGPATFGPDSLRESMLAVIESHWGVGSLVFTNLLMPGASPDEAAEFARSQRKAAPPAVAAGFLRQMFAVDVTAMLPQIRVPSLVIHYRGDKAIPFTGAEQLVAGLPDVEFAPLEGVFHMPPLQDVDRIAATIRRFLGMPH